MKSISEALAAAEDALSRQPLKSIIPKHQNIMCLEHNSTVGAALQLLAKHHILSAPLVIMPGLEDLGLGGDDEEVAAAAPRLIGWVTVESILRAFLTHMEAKHGKLPRNMLLLMTLLEKEGPAFAEKPLITVSGSEDRGLIFSVNSNVSLTTALRESFVPRGRAAVHRLAVFDASGAITAVISQLDIIRHFNKHPDQLGALAELTVEQLGWAGQPQQSVADGSTVGDGGGGGESSVPSRPLVAVDASLPAILAFERMVHAGLSGAPVLADLDVAVGSGSGTGYLIANLSMSDLRNIQSQHLGILALPVAEFLALLHNTAYLGYSQRTSEQATHPFFAVGPLSVPPPRGPPSPGGDIPEASAEEPEGEGAIGIRMISCTTDTTLRKVLALLADNKVHRVYVGITTHGSQACLIKPVAVITPTDILRLLAWGN